LRALGAFSIGAIASVTAGAVLKSHPPGGSDGWARTNYAGDGVTLLEGPAFVVGAVAGAVVAGAGVPAAVAGLGGAAFGALDDLVGASPSKGLRGHLAAARRGEVTTGALKIVGLGATGLLTAWIMDRSRSRRRPITTLIGGAVVAGSANIVNLLDLRPGRALKVALLLSTPLLAGRGTPSSKAAAGAVAGAAIVCLPEDLAGRSMLGDTGANSAGALLGAALVARTGMPGRLLALAAVTALTLASERFSFTTFIESTPGLRELDALGRPPV
jgi:UDP-N-acetylmuramyl pentapeptide phosphotransferase/UDP-N-acetylglucosamine-1-phosphate transferase